MKLTLTACGIPRADRITSPPCRYRQARAGTIVACALGNGPLSSKREIERIARALAEDVRLDLTSSLTYRQVPGPAASSIP